LRLTPITKNQENGILNITYQGCWEGGICYPQLKTSLTLSGL
jgi:thiol:disulfide interchange protein DsbD